MRLTSKLKIYYATAVLSVIFAVSEDNNTIRVAAFEMLLHLAELEQIVFAAHYDQDKDSGNPRSGWVKVGLINDLSVLINPVVTEQARMLKDKWAANWQQIPNDSQAAQQVLSHIDSVRASIKTTITRLQ